MPELRRPTERAAAWANWQARIDGARVGHAITNDVQCGWYRAKRDGQYVAVQIDLISETDDDGFLLAEERFVAFVGRDHFYELAKIEAIWLRCCGNPITEAEAERLLNAPRVRDLSREVII